MGAHRDRVVGQRIGRGVGKPAPSVSQHLAKLRMARLVRTRRAGTTIYYSLENEHVRQLVVDAVFNAGTRRPRNSVAPSGRSGARRPSRQSPATKGQRTMSHLLHSHDHADGLDDELQSSAAGIRVVKISLVVLGHSRRHR